ncbi:MAG TPA: aldolase/citrate lyase family protein [Stellaceae bacterium]|nr:aldolase/citrate lyase family protein [Stellaceae bacterium]
MEIRNAARARLEKGELALGVGLRAVRSVDIAKMMKTCDYDWIFIDLEHGPFSIETATSLAVAALDTGISPIVRVPFRQYAMATRMLDGGALGIVMPHVDTPEQAREIVDHLKYPPQGHRSLAGGQAIADFRPVAIGTFAEAANRALLVIVMLETPTAIRNAAAIAAIPGVDALLIGTNDLAAEMGIPGAFGDDRIVAAYETVIAACRSANKWPGVGGVYSPDLLERYVGMGAKLVLTGGDSGFLMEAAGARAALVRGWQRGSHG